MFLRPDRSRRTRVTKWLSRALTASQSAAQQLAAWGQTRVVDRLDEDSLFDHRPEASGDAVLGSTSNAEPTDSLGEAVKLRGTLSCVKPVLVDRLQYSVSLC